eukprot:3841698-Pyramimonas_sp.AAC.1
MNGRLKVDASPLSRSPHNVAPESWVEESFDLSLRCDARGGVAEGIALQRGLSGLGLPLRSGGGGNPEDASGESVVLVCHALHTVTRTAWLGTVCPHGSTALVRA